MDASKLDYAKIGQRIRAARKKLGWQQAELAFRANITTAHISHIETGNTNLALPAIVKIANALSVSVCARHGTNLASESLATGIYRQV